MILTVNIGNTHITIAGYEHDTLQFSGRLHSSPAATVDEYAMNLLNLLSLYQVAPRADRGRHSGQCGARTDRPGIGCTADVLLCPLPDRWPRPEKRHQAAAGQPGPAGRRAAVRCGGRTGRGTRTAGGHLGRYRHLHHGSQRQTGTGGRCHPARAAALPFRAGAKKPPSCPRSTSPLQLPPRSWARTPLPAYRTVLCWAPPDCWMGWPSAFRQSLARISAFMPPATCPAPSERPAAHPFSTGSI